MKHVLLALALLASITAAFAQAAPATEKSEKAAKADKAVKYKSDGKLPVDPDSHLVTYTGVIEVPGATQAQLYARAATWVAGTSNFRVASSKQLLEAADKSQLTVSGDFPARAGFSQSPGTITHNLTIYLKDGRYKYVLTNLREESTMRNLGSGGAFENEKPACGGMGMFVHVWNSIKRNADEDIHELLTRLTSAMANPSKAASDF